MNEDIRTRCLEIIRDADIELDWLLHAVAAVDRWLDAEVAGDYKDQPLAQDWGRVAKVAEEIGEAQAELDATALAVAQARVSALNVPAGRAIAALILATGQNPRKGTDPGARDRLLAELADTAVTAIFAIQHFTKDEARTWTEVTKAVGKAYYRAPEEYQ